MRRGEYAYRENKTGGQHVGENGALETPNCTQVLTCQQPLLVHGRALARTSPEENNSSANEHAASEEKIYSCLICGCPSLWSDRYTGQLHCDECEPPPGQSLIARRYVVLVTQSGKQALLELDRETLAIDPADYDQVYFERQAVGSRPQTDDSSQWATWTEPDGTVVTVAAWQLREHETGRAGPKPGRNFAEWWSAGSDGKFLNEAIDNYQKSCGSRPAGRPGN